jgi:tetratricopeptide (TPR) repeat protein
MQKASFNLAIVHHENGKSGLAKSRLLKVLRDAEVCLVFPDRLAYFQDDSARVKYSKGLAQVHQELGSHKLAIKYYKISLDYDASDKEVWDNLGNAYGSLGKFDDALECFRKVTELDSADMDALLKVGHTLQDHKKVQHA